MHYSKNYDMICAEDFKISITHCYCLEYYEVEKKMMIELDFREPYYILAPELINHWEKPYENIEIDPEKKQRILRNIREYLLTRTIPSRIIMKDIGEVE